MTGRRFVSMLWIVLLLACGPAASDSADTGMTDTTVIPTPKTTLVMVFDTMGFTNAESETVAPGFDLDGVVSEDGDESTCGHGDYTAPDGTPGIDNQLATIVPLFELVGLTAAEGLLQSIIEEGGLLMMIQLDGVDDPVNDDKVSLLFRTGFGSPLLGTDGKVLAGQTFTLHSESPDSLAEDASITDGVLHAGPFTARIPLLVFGMKYELTLHNTRIRATMTEDGGMVDGLLGGSVAIDELYAIGETAAKDDPSVLTGIQAVVSGAGDMARDEDGQCQEISGTFAISAVSAFFFPEENSN
jgi:hypothetical protein